MKIQNPIIPGFAPDPSVVFVDGTFVLVNSSFHVFPGLPIYTSKDLQHWELRGHALARPFQLDLSAAFAKVIEIPEGGPIFVMGGLFAPTIRFFKNRYYIVCTYAYQKADGTSAFQNFLLSCARDEIFAGGWSDPVFFDFPGIDPGLFFDEKTGQAYLHGSYRTGPAWAPQCSIRQFEIDVSTGVALSPCRLLWNGSGGKDDAEGPHLYYKDEWYYLLTAECSTFEGHQINMARSRDLWGPYEGCPANPLLTAYEKDEDVRWTGHGDLFQDEQGNWFCVHLGIRYDRANPDRHPLGRETFLTPVKWPIGEWPSIQQTKLSFEVSSSKCSAPEVPQGDTTDRGNVHLENVYIRTPNLEDYTVPTGGKKISLRARPATLTADSGTVTFVGRRQRSLIGTASVRITLGATNPGDDIVSGLTVYKDQNRHYSLRIDHVSRTIFSHLASPLQNKHRPCELATASIAGSVSAVELRIEADGKAYKLFWRPVLENVSQEWHGLGEVDGEVLSGHDMTGTIYGIFASRDGHQDPSLARWVVYESFATI